MSLLTGFCPLTKCVAHSKPMRGHAAAQQPIVVASAYRPTGGALEFCEAFMARAAFCTCLLRLGWPAADFAYLVVSQLDNFVHTGHPAVVEALLPW